MRSGRKRSDRHKQAIYENRRIAGEPPMHLNKDILCVLAESEAAGITQHLTK